MSFKEQALRYHQEPTPGKIEVISTKPCQTAKDLSLAYSPGVAEPCLEIAENPESVFKYTSKGNLVAVISNGTAVLGLGDIGPAASKPVMEGKGVLFKTFAHVDVFDLELDCKSKEDFIEAVAALGPTFGGINLEDIKAPECFEIEEELIERLDIPVFHDDQHGTAIIAAAALVNALEITGRKIESSRLVVSGAGAAAIATVRLLFTLGMKKENVILCDSTGVVYKGREKGMNAFKEQFAIETEYRTLEDALAGADIFFGLSKKDLLSPEMLLSMGKNPVVFAMANPDPEIDYALAKATRDDVIMATGRSDWPNQVNNVLGFPYIFRGALDVRARRINNEMKLAAVEALAKLAKEPVPESVCRAYGNTKFSFGTDYLIPKPFDPRVLFYVAPAVAKAAIDSGVARINIDIEQYTLSLKAKQDKGRSMLSGFYSVAKDSRNKKIIFSEGENEKVIQAASMAAAEAIAEPILVGDKSIILERISKMELDSSAFHIIDPRESELSQELAALFLSIRDKDGLTLDDAKDLLKDPHVFSNLYLKSGRANGLIAGVGKPYPETIRPILKIIGMEKGVKTASSLYMLSIKDRTLFFTDTALNTEMSEEKLTDIALMAAEFVESMDIEPRLALLSYSNFGGIENEQCKMLESVVTQVRKKNQNVVIDGPMQADTATEYDILKDLSPNSPLDMPANVFIFPDMQSANISYKLLQRLAGARVVGPVILGLSDPAFVLQRHASVDEIFNMTTIAVARAEITAKLK